MKQIKTIKNRLDNNVDFDKEVNAALAEGWKLVKRDVINPHAHPVGNIFNTMLYAELEREVYHESEPKKCTNCKHGGTFNNPVSPCRRCDGLDKWEAKA